MIVRGTSAVALLALLVAACGGRTVVTTPRASLSPSQMAELRVDPGTRPRDLFWGVGGKRYAPPPDAVYAFKAKDEAGFSVSYDVTSPDGMEWSAKIGSEAQTEVVVSRILWGLGYHQPPVYYLPSWTVRAEAAEPATGSALDIPGTRKAHNRAHGWLPVSFGALRAPRTAIRLSSAAQRIQSSRKEPYSGPRRESEARFRPKLPHLARLEEVWSWADNPFSGTRELKGLLVIMLMLNSTDLKDSNNSVYELTEPWDGASRWFVVRDIGAALGETGRLFPRRNWLEAFEEQSFITSLAGGTIEFDYDGRHQELLTMITPADVQWAARQMARLTDAQWRDAFRAGNYAEPMAERYIGRIKEKIADGMALRVDRRETEETR